MTSPAPTDGSAPDEPTPATERPKRQEQEEASEEVTEVAPGVLRMQLPIMMPGLGHVNCYALEDERGYTLVDPGLPGPDSFAALESRLAQAGARVQDVHTVFVTHSHPDHFGGAGRLRLAVGADVVAHRDFRTIFDPADDDSVELIDAHVPVTEPDGLNPIRFAEYLLEDIDIPDMPGRTSPWGGVIPFPPKEELLRMRAWDRETKEGFLSPQPTIRIDDAQVVRLARREWLAVHTPGHTGDHLCLFDPVEGILLSGDHVLPTITPHISGLATGEDNLADFFAALEKVSELEGVRHVLPAHGHPFTDVSARAKDIRRHHEERLAHLRDLTIEHGEADVITLSHELFHPRSWGSMAESETFAHLEHLRHRGEVSSRQAEGLLWYRIAS
ncbi:MAG TPA: MBL fold metallo-hydrolase [Microthrixaceae bacterium]|nr:MBL fold metallo-hydrolase [Microthrixaceae bacterium]